MICLQFDFYQIKITKNDRGHWTWWSLNKNGKIYKMFSKSWIVVSSMPKICLTRVQVAVASDFWTIFISILEALVMSEDWELMKIKTGTSLSASYRPQIFLLPRRTMQPDPATSARHWHTAHENAIYTQRLVCWLHSGHNHQDTRDRN